MFPLARTKCSKSNLRRNWRGCSITDSERHFPSHTPSSQVSGHIITSNKKLHPLFLDTEYARLRSLRDPNKKMSKSDPDPKSRICLTDKPDDIVRNIKKAVTDFTSEVKINRRLYPFFLSDDYKFFRLHMIRKSDRAFLTLSVYIHLLRTRVWMKFVKRRKT